MRRRLLPLCLCSLLLGATAARAEQLVLGVEQDLTFQSNLFRTPENEENDLSYRLRPYLRLLRDERALRYDLLYRPSFDFYFENDELNDDSHFVRGDLEWSPVPTGVASLRGELAHYRTVRSTEDVDTDTIPDVLAGGRGRITRAFGDLGYEQRVEPDWIAAGRLGIQSYTFTNRDTPDNLGLVGEASLVHELRPGLALGGSLLGSHRSFDEQEAQGIPESRNVVVNGSLVLRAEPMPTVQVELLGGPALVATFRDGQDGTFVRRFRGSGTGADTVAAVFDPARCPEVSGQFLLSGCPLEPAPALAGQLDEQVFVDFDPGARPGPEEDTELTGFVRALIRKEDSWGFASLAYSRWEEGSAGIRSTTVRDSLTATLQLLPGNWSVRLRGNWNQREAVDRTERSAVRAGPSPVPAGPFFFAEATGLVPAAITGTTRVTQLWADFRAVRPVWNDRLEIELRARYLHQERDGVSGDSVEFDNVTGSIGIRYEFRPIRFLE